ncbi:hypothetical protein ABPG77_002444 [Micractinium sp. CCAP 211/92]
MAGSDWSSLTVVKLKEECKKRGLPVGGKKSELVERLEQHEGGEASPEASPSAGEEQAEQEQPAEEEAAAEEAEEAAGEEQPAEEAGPTDAQQPATNEQPAAEPAVAAGAAGEGKEAEEQPMEAEDAAPAAAEASPSEEQAQQAEAAPAAMEADQPAAAEAEPAKGKPEQEHKEQRQEPQAAQAAPAAADVDLDYGEESDGEGAAAAEEESAKRKREEEPGSGKRGAGAGAAAAAVRAAAASGSDAAGGRPAKVPRSGSGFSLGSAAKGAAPAPEDVPAAGEPATRALRIDGFVRPFHERQVRELLSETGEVKALWMPSIKTHCYVVFETKAQAEATRRATYQLQWPATNPKRLAPRFVPLAEAETSIGNGAGNPDFRIKRTEEDGEEAAPAAEAPTVAAPEPKEEASKAPDRSQREWNRNRRSPSPPPLEGVRDLREMLSRRQSGGSAVAAAAAAAADVSRGRELPPGLGALPGERREREREAERRASGGAPPPRQEERVLTLDELFKKTTCKPCIYWLPLTDEQVAEKKQKAAEATAAPGEGGKPSENGTAAS